jgi:hypothetical protein
MRGLHAATPFVAAAVALLGVTCAFPSDNSPEVYVTIESPSLVLLDGDETLLHARAWRRVGVPDTGNVDDQEVHNVDFAWSSGSGLIARVDNNGGGYATVLGVAPGLTDITARAVAFERSSSGALPLRVARLLEIDSVTPRSVKWGDKLTLWGVGVRFAFLTSLEGSGLIPDTLTYGESGGFSHMEFWVPQPARTSQLFVLGPGVFFNTPDSVTVDTVDLYEPNTTAPTQLSLDGPGPYPTVPFIKFLNPALAFEQLPRGTKGGGFDWYRFARSDTARQFELIIKPQANSDSSGAFILVGDSIVFNGNSHSLPATQPFWFVTSQGLYACARGFFAPNIQPFDSMVVALKTLPRYVPGNNGIHVLNVYGRSLNYTMVALDTIITAPQIGQDRFEENDVCTMADDPAKIIAVTPVSTFADTLTIDVPHDLDWYRIRVTAPLAADSTTVRVASRPLGGAAAVDRSDLDLYLLDTTFNLIRQVNDVGSRDELRLRLPSGDYYLAVVDFPGEPTRYSLCISVRISCTPPFAPSAALPSVPRRSSISASPGVRSDGQRIAIPASQMPTDRRFPFRRQ